jgi:quercetin dioxygenase-like cupin family protein
VDGSQLSRFDDDGFVGPVRLFTDPEWSRVAHHVTSASHPAPADWTKGRAVTDPTLYWLATRPPLLDGLTRLLGADVVLWGVSVIRRKPGQEHPWHTDIESSASEGGFASVWIGVEHTGRESGLQLIRRSHRLGVTIQEAAARRGIARGEAAAHTVLAWAREIDPLAEIVQPEIRDGDALFFDGRLWHGSHNALRRVTRTALLLQYAKASRKVRRPDFSRLEWPFRFLDEAPPVLLVHGTAPQGVNRIVQPPAGKGGEVIASSLHRLALPLGEDPVKGWRPHPLFRGPTPLLERMGSHVSVLSPGHSPHPPHVHPEEELLIVLDGEAEIVLADDASGRHARTERLTAGSFSYYPSGQHHTIRNAATQPVTYLMFKWIAAPSGAPRPLDTRIVHAASVQPPAGVNGFGATRVFEQGTAYLRRLHCHLSVVQPGGGYDSHVDAHDVAIVVLSGRIETLGEVVGPCGVVYCGAGTPHGLTNPGDEPARYLVFEFHAAEPAHASLPGRRWWKTRGRSLLGKGYRKARRAVLALAGGSDR